MKNFLPCRKFKFYKTLFSLRILPHHKFPEEEKKKEFPFGF